MLEGPHHLADRGLLVERWQPEADRESLTLLQVDETLEPGELAAVEGVFREPAIDAFSGGGAALDAKGPVRIL